MTAHPRHRTGALTLAVALVLGAAGCSTPAAVEADTSPSASAEASEPSPTPSPTPSVDPLVEATAAQQVALEALVAEAQPSIPTLYESFPGLYSQIAITSEGASTLVYSYVYSEEATAGTSLPEMQAAMAGLGSTLQESCEAQLFPVMTAAGITIDPQIRYAYATPAGEKVWSYTCVPGA